MSYTCEHQHTNIPTIIHKNVSYRFSQEVQFLHQVKFEQLVISYTLSARFTIGLFKFCSVNKFAINCDMWHVTDINSNNFEINYPPFKRDHIHFVIYIKLSDTFSSMGEFFCRMEVFNDMPYL